MSQFDAQARSSTPHEPGNRPLGDPQVSDPAEVLDLTVERFPALDEMDPQIGMGCSEGQVTDKTESMLSARFRALTLVIGNPSSLLSLGLWLKQKGMIAFQPRDVGPVWEPRDP